MDIEDLNQFRKILFENNKSVSDLEYTENNYSDNGILIKENLPTITTDFCEIGLFEGHIYLVFIIESKTFNLEFFNSIKYKENIKIYGFVNFNKTLYPNENFDYGNFLKLVQSDKYLQVQFDFKNMEALDLFAEYDGIVNVFNENNVIVINQLKINLRNN